MNESYEAEETAVLASSASESDSDATETAAEGNEKGPLTGALDRRKRGRKNVITPQLAAALDRTKVSDRKLVFVIADCNCNCNCKPNFVNESEAN